MASWLGREENEYFFSSSSLRVSTPYKLVTLHVSQRQSSLLDPDIPPLAVQMPSLRRLLSSRVKVGSALSKLTWIPLLGRATMNPFLSFYTPTADSGLYRNTRDLQRSAPADSSKTGIESAKDDMAVEWIYGQQLRHHYASGLDPSEGVVVQTALGEFIWAPVALHRFAEGLFSIALQMNARVSNSMHYQLSGIFNLQPVRHDY